MTSERGPETPRRVKQSKKPHSAAIFNPRSKGPTPTEKHDTATQTHIDWLEKEIQEHRANITRLHELVNDLRPENARLKEALTNAESSSLISTVLVILGGAIISYATFVGGKALQIANIGVGLLLGGIILMLWTQASRRSRVSKGS